MSREAKTGSSSRAHVAGEMIENALGSEPEAAAFACVKVNGDTDQYEVIIAIFLSFDSAF